MTAPLQTPTTGPGCQLHCWPNDCKLEGPTTHFSGSINLEEWLTESRETFIYVYQFIIKDTDEEV